MTTEVTPEIDVPRLRKELEYVTAHRARWFQGAWVTRTACGTIGCLAGNTVMNAGYRPSYVHGTTNNTRFVLDLENTIGTVRHFAQKLLGLTDDQASDLFCGTNSLYRLWEIASDITDGEIEIPLEVVQEMLDDVVPANGGTLLREENDRAYVLRVQKYKRQRQRAVNELADQL